MNRTMALVLGVIAFSIAAGSHKKFWINLNKYRLKSQ
jgi:hypothetical protein